MDRRRAGVGAALGAVAFFVCFVMLTAERLGLFDMATSTESVTLRIGAVVTVVVTAGFVYRGGGLPGTWLLALGPSLAFTLNLFLPVSVDVPAALIFGGASGAVVATALAVPGYALGRVTESVGSAISRDGSPEP